MTLISLQLLSCLSRCGRRLLLFSTLIPSNMRVCDRHSIGSASRTARRLTRLRDWRVGIDGRTVERAHFHVLDVLCEELLPVGKSAEFVFGEATEIMGEMSLEAACDEGSRCVATGPSYRHEPCAKGNGASLHDVIRSKRSVDPSRGGDIVDIAVDAQVYGFRFVGTIVFRKLLWREDLLGLQKKS
jgi:hypothetical protein